jgi:hypothetical protein
MIYVVQIQPDWLYKEVLERGQENTDAVQELWATLGGLISPSCSRQYSQRIKK